MSNEIEESKLAAPRGMKDSLPAEASERQKLRDATRAVFESYGFQPLETPALENWEVLSSKYAGGEEILKETYSLEDQGGRKMGLRYDLTVPMCRVMANNPKMPMPFKRYQIQPVWRDGPVKLGRYREFYQCDVDTVGVESVVAEAELFALANAVFQKLGLDAEIRVSNRKFLNGMLEYAGVPQDKIVPAILSIDKLAKIGKEGVEKELLEERKVPSAAVKKVLELISLENSQLSNEQKLEKIKSKINSKEGKQGAIELEQLLEYCKAFKLTNIVFSPSLSRGLSYYTGAVFEAYLKNGAIKSSIAAGGRYDDMIGKFLGSPNKVPAVGISFGLDVIVDAINQTRNVPKSSIIQVFIIPIGTMKESIEIADVFRRNALNTAIDLMERGPSKNLEFASKQNIPYCVIVGKKELAQGKVKLKDMRTGEEKELFPGTALELVQMELQKPS
ncbi:MAG TPA: histidine--tRNA ligase [Candidatus Norongarragalinales archaeon]|jgi:histidyl-tRNA synthetase|nr:histidine--tRNA ligase [Candidatus Norongarragalinales archaeon]